MRSRVAWWWLIQVLGRKVVGHGLGFGQEQQEDLIALGFSGALRLGVEGVRCGLRLLLELVLACAWSALIGRKGSG